MKQGWEKKKLPDVLWFQEGPGVRKHQYVSEGIKLLNVANLVNGKLDLSTSDRYISIDEAYGKYKHFLVDEGDLILASSGIQVEYIEKKMGFVQKEHLPLCMNTSTIRFKTLNKNVLNIEYFMYFLKSYEFKRQLFSLITGCAQLNYGPSHLKQMVVPVPPIADQEKIVAELDCLSGIIEKKKQQLKELDNLAQSIFYEMFGDPVENDKGWEMKRLGDISEVTSFKRVLIEDVVDEGVPFIRGTELSALSKLPNSKNYEFTLFITPEHYNKVKAISGVPKIGDLLIPSINADGLIWVVDTNEPRYYKDGRVLWVHTNQEYSNSLALRYIMSNKLRLLYKELASGATFIELKLFVLRDMVLPFPPQTIQQEFASKIEAIEKQKELIAQSIKETETLFNSRMDYYFN